MLRDIRNTCDLNVKNCFLVIYNKQSIKLMGNIKFKIFCFNFYLFLASLISTWRKLFIHLPKKSVASTSSWVIAGSYIE